MPRTRRKTKTTASRSAGTAASATFTCPECGRTFSRAAALGAHRSRAHGIAGSSRASRTSQTRGRRRAAATTGTTRRAGQSSTRATVDRDGLLQLLFPNGVPAREAVIREANSWLDQAERLARMK